MRNHTFFIVVRENDMDIGTAMRLHRENGRLYGGWEFADNIEIADWAEAKRMMEEYKMAMPSHTVRIHARRIV